MLLALIEYARDTKQVCPCISPFRSTRFPLAFCHPGIAAIHPNANDQLEVLSDFFAQLDEWKARWGTQLTVEKERQLYLLVSQTLEAAGGKKASEAHKFLVKYLATFTDEQQLGKSMVPRGGGWWWCMCWPQGVHARTHPHPLIKQTRPPRRWR